LEAVKRVEKWRWKTLWAGKMVAGKVLYSEAEIRERHPEAEKVPGTMKLVELPETEEEIAAGQRPANRGAMRK
jgi:hypothetical protein